MRKFISKNQFTISTPQSKVAHSNACSIETDKTGNQVPLLPSPTSMGHNHGPNNRHSENHQTTDIHESRTSVGNSMIDVEIVKHRRRSKIASLLAKTTVFTDGERFPPLSPANPHVPIKKRRLSALVSSNTQDENDRNQSNKIVIRNISDKCAFSEIFSLFVRRKPISRIQGISLIQSQDREAFIPSNDFLCQVQKSSITREARQELINLVENIHKSHGYYHPETTWLSVNYMDRYLSRTWCRYKYQRQLLAVAAAMLAGKVMEEAREPTIRTIIKSSKVDIDSKKLLKMEHKLLKILEWRLVPPNTPYTIFHSLLNYLEVPIDLQKRMFYYLERIYGYLFYHEKTVVFEPNVLITAILLHIMEGELEKCIMSSILYLLGIRPGCPYRQCQLTIQNIHS